MLRLKFRQLRRGIGAWLSGYGTTPDASMQDAIRLYEAGQFSAAAACCDQRLAVDDRDPDALHLRGLIAGAQGEHGLAADLLEQTANVEHADPTVHVALAVAYRALGRLEESLTSLEQAVALDPEQPAWLTDVGSTLRLLGRAEAAVKAYRRALNVDPDYVPAHYGLGSTRLDLGALEAAKASLERAVALDPHHANAWNNLGLARFHAGELTEAMGAYETALALRPDYPEAHNNVGVVHQSRHELDAAQACFERAIALDPGYLGAQDNLGLLFQERGEYASAKAHYRAILQTTANDATRVRVATLLPVIPSSVAEIRAAREHVRRETSALSKAHLYLSDPLSQIGGCNFHLAYHGESDRALQMQIAHMYESACPSLGFEAPHCRRYAGPARRIKVGFISKFMHEHSIGRTTRGILARLSKERFEVHALFVPPFVDDTISAFIREHADATVVLPPTLAGARERVASLELDVLFYQDIGMDPFTYFLAFSRLAPVQCLSFGHPDTTGIPNMDYFVSSDLFEPPGAEAHYSERLFLLKNLGTLAYYYRPQLDEPPKSAAALGLPEGKHLYLCPQTLFKFHPDFDPMLGDILRADPEGVLLVIRGKTLHWAELLRNRFAATIPDVLDRVVFLRGYSRADFVHLVAACDVMLDTIHFNGMNTSLEAFAVGTPVVTLPTALQRGRHTFGMYTRMGLNDGVATTSREYVDIALRLGSDRSARDAVKEKILADSHVLFEDENVVREFERFFIEAVAKATP